MLEVKFKCQCINECVTLGIDPGMTFSGTARIDESGDTTFAVDLPGGGPFTVGQELFANYFRIIK